MGGVSAAKGTGAFSCGFCGTVRCGGCVIEVPRLIITPLFGAGVHGAEEPPEKVTSHHICLRERCQCVAGFAFYAAVASSVPGFSACGEGGMESDRWGAMIKKKFCYM